MKTTHMSTNPLKQIQPSPSWSRNTLRIKRSIKCWLIPATFLILLDNNRLALFNNDIIVDKRERTIRSDQTYSALRFLGGNIRSLHGLSLVIPADGAVLFGCNGNRLPGRWHPAAQRAGISPPSVHTVSQWLPTATAGSYLQSRKSIGHRYQGVYQWECTPPW